MTCVKQMSFVVPTTLAFLEFEVLALVIWLN